MTVSRRSLLWHSILAAIACAAKPLTAWSAKKNGAPGNPTQNKVTSAGWQHLDRAAFTRVVGSSFKVTANSGNATSVWLHLIAVEDLPPLAPPNLGIMAVQPPKTTAVTTTGFMLSFLGTMPKQLPQGTYTFEHPGLGKFWLFIVPSAPGQQTYTAVINKLN